MSASDLAALLWTFGLITAGIWGLTEILGASLLKKHYKPLIAVILGAIFYPVLTLVGIFAFPIDLHLPWWNELIASFILGLVCIGASALLNDKIINPFKNILTR